MKKREKSKSKPLAKPKKPLPNKSGTKLKRLTQWFVGTIIGVLLLSVVGNHISAVIPSYNRERTHSGKFCYGKTPMQSFLASKKLADEKMLDMLLAGSVAENAGPQAVG